MLIADSPASAAAETFEYLTYTPPPGWVAQDNPEGKIYVGKDSGGNATAVIALYSSRPTNSPAPEAFATLWRAHVEKVVPGSPPEPKLGREGDFVLAAGNRQASVQGVAITATLVVFVGRGRVFGAVGVARGDEMGRLVYDFFGSLRLNAATIPGGAATPPAGLAAGEIEVDFEVPPGYMAGRQGRNIVLTSATSDRQTPCTYGLSPSRPSRGSLEADAEAALLDVLPGWQRMDDKRRVMRGTSDSGWPYFWTKADMWQGPSAFSERGIAMAMTFPAAPGRVNVVWGKGNSLCNLDDTSFVRLFLSLRPRTWTPDGGKALARDLLGTWRWTNGYSSANTMMQYTFDAEGRFVYDAGSITQLGVTERTSANTGGGQYSLRGSEITLTRSGGAKKAYRIRIYDELGLGGWKRVLSLLDESASPPVPMEFFRVDAGAR